MKITVITRNQPRHLSLIERLAGIADEVFAIQECNTVFPGAVADFIRKSEVMQDYFSRVIAAEEEVFGGVRFTPPNVRTLSLKFEDLNGMDIGLLAPALQSDLYVVFGSSYIKGPLIDALVERQAINVHLGVSPYYRGNSCNFWALYDGNPDLVGATIHRLTRGLDSGGILFHAFPKPGPVDPFVLGMRSVEAAHICLAEAFQSGRLQALEPIAQDRAAEIRYTRNSEFTDEIATEFLARHMSAGDVGRMFDTAPQRLLVDPRYA
ncbi:MAG: methionyl-tRNA formyltransferase [Magnetospirillum sp.]|nr:methionyl-tRNA formyltransferase [Magnetospirillum sp.]